MSERSPAPPADAGMARNQHKLRPAMGYDAVERFQQCGDLSFPPVELLRNDQSIRDILFAERKFGDVIGRLPRCKALPKIGLDSAAVW